MHQKQTFTLDEALQKLEHFCAYQERCHQEVITKLKAMGMIPAAIDTIVSHLIQSNYLNETRFAQSYARGKFRIKKWGKVRIKRELKARKISDYNIKLALREISATEYDAVFWALFEKQKERVKGGSSAEKKKKLLAFFSYRGWESERIYQALNEL